MLAVVVADVQVEGEYQFERRHFGSTPEQLQVLGEWLLEQMVEEAVMESTAQYWKPVWGALERYWSRGARSGKVPALFRERCIWRRRNHVRLQNQFEALLEEAHIKLSSLVSDLLGASARRMLQALADGETDPAALAALADTRLRATPAQLRDALGACSELNPVYRRLLKMALKELQLIDEQIGQMDQEMASLLKQHQDAVQRLAEVPGLGPDSAQQIIAEVGATAAPDPRIHRGEQVQAEGERVMPLKTA
jgi:hypothetical protein